jgi:hypothetical protein
MISRGILDPKYHDLADGVFGQMNFTLLVLHVHLLVEKALNFHLAQAGVPEILLGSEGMEFHQKVKGFMQLRGYEPTGQNLFTVLNTLRNNIAHDFWDERACVKDAFQRFMPAKKHREILEQTASTPIDSVKLLYVLLAKILGIAVAQRGPELPGA